MTEQPKLAPHSPEAEEAVLGSILLDPDMLLVIKPLLTAQDFFVVRNAWVYEAMLDISRRNEDIDNLSLIDELRRRTESNSTRLEQLGGSAYITYLINNTPTAFHVRTYAGIVHRAAVRRRLLAVATSLAQMALEENSELHDLIEHIYAELDDVAQTADGDGLVSFGQAVDETSDEWVEWLADPRDLRGFTTGLHDLDNLVGGFMPGRVTSLIMPTSGGKSTFMRQISLALIEQGPGLIVPTEMHYKSFIHSTVSQCLGLKPRTLERGTPDPDERIAHEYSRLMNAQGHFLTGRSPTIYSIETAARRLRRRYGSQPLWMIVDSGSNVIVPKQSRIYEVTSQVMGTLAQIAVDYGFHVFASWQINREAYNQDSADITSGLGSGAIERDSDLVMTIHREDYKEKTGQIKSNGKQLDFDSPVKATLKILKHRHSPIAGRIVPMHFKLGRGFFPDDTSAEVPAQYLPGNGRYGERDDD